MAPDCIFCLASHNQGSSHRNRFGHWTQEALRFAECRHGSIVTLASTALLKCPVIYKLNTSFSILFVVCRTGCIRREVPTRTAEIDFCPLTHFGLTFGGLKFCRHRNERGQGSPTPKRHLCWGGRGLLESVNYADLKQERTRNECEAHSRGQQPGAFRTEQHRGTVAEKPQVPLSWHTTH